jgi:hypothetical protein
MGNMKEYKIASGSSAEELETEINRIAQDGFEPAGNMLSTVNSFHLDKFYQLMVRTK